MKKRAFTLAEMMVVMLILTIILAAFAPLMTKRRTVDISTAWRFAANNSDIYYGMGSSQTAMIGQNSKASGENARLIINTSDSNQRHAIFKQAGSKVGELWVNGRNLLLGSGFSDSFSGNNNTAFGYYSLRNNTSGRNNTAIGTYALQNNTTGLSNTAIGYDASKNNSTGQYNTAIGYSSLANNTWGSYNTATGFYSLRRNTTGSNNTAIGFNSLGSNTTGINNTAVGDDALSSNTTGSSNTAVGLSALHKNIEGNYNTAVGSGALGLTTGSYNTAIGRRACAFAVGSNKTCLGYDSGPIYDDSSTTNVVYLGSSSTTGIISGVSAISVYSDKRLKNIKDEYKNGLEQIRNIVPKYFTYKKDEDKVLRVGVVAQEVQKVLPDAVEKNGDGYLIVKQERIQYALLNAVKQLDKIIQNLITEVKTIVAKLNYHDEKIKKLEQENAELKARLEKLEKATF